MTQQQNVFLPVLLALIVFWALAKPDFDQSATAWIVQQKCDGGTNAEHTHCVGATKPAGVLEVRLFPSERRIVARIADARNGLDVLVSPELLEIPNCAIFDTDNWSCDSGKPPNSGIGEVGLTKKWAAQDGRFVYTFDNVFVRENYIGTIHTTRVGKWLSQYGIWPR